MESSYRNCAILGDDEQPIAESLVVDLTLHQKAITAPESTCLWRGLIRTTQKITLEADSIVTLDIPGMETRLVEILEPQNETDNSIPFRGMGPVPIARTGDDE